MGERGSLESRYRREPSRLRARFAPTPRRAGSQCRCATPAPDPARAARDEAPRQSTAERLVGRNAGQLRAAPSRPRRTAAATTLAAGMRPTSSPAPTRCPASLCLARRCAPRAGAAPSRRGRRCSSRPALRRRSRSPSACTPRSPPHDSRTAAATSCGDVERPLELDVERQERRAHADEHRAARGSSLAGPWAGTSSPASIRRCSSTGPPRR